MFLGDHHDGPRLNRQGCLYIHPLAWRERQREVDLATFNSWPSDTPCLFIEYRCSFKADSRQAARIFRFIARNLRGMGVGFVVLGTSRDVNGLPHTYPIAGQAVSFFQG